MNCCRVIGSRLKNHPTKPPHKFFAEVRLAEMIRSNWLGTGSRLEVDWEGTGSRLEQDAILPLEQ